MRLPKGVGHYTRNLDNFESLELIGIFTGVSNMDKETTGYESLGEILDHERIFR
jgi:hypothetical protein